MSKIFILFSLIIISELSAQVEIIFSHERGFYDNSFELTISASEEGAEIRYTLDGSNPYTTPSAFESASPLNITIDPTNVSYRDKAPGFIVKACITIAETLASDIVTHTYLFTNKIVELSPDNELPGNSWLVPGTNTQEISYGLDSDIYNNPVYTNQIINAFTSIPSLSLTMDLKNLFDPDSGIYVNAFYHGEEWEKEASLELLNSDGSEGFHINCGVRIRGGWSRYPHNPKHAFRIFFRSEYGEGKLNFPLFDDEGADEYNKIDIQTAQNYSWSFYGDDQNTFLRELFSRDTQRDMGQPYTRGKFCHLYINGTYWGLFQLQERAEASFGETYFGGDKEDYDVVKVNIGQLNEQEIYQIEATDGTLDKWQELWLAGKDGFDSDELYFKIQGLNSDGTINPSYDKLLDVNNLIDYMINTFFVGDFDGPVSAFRGNNSPNNFFAIYNRLNPDGFKFFRHDAEHSLFDINENRTGPFPAGNNFEDSNPQWLHTRLSENPHYRLYFADRVYKHFFNEGALTLEKNSERITKRKNEIELAVIAESARWGDSKTSQPKTKEHWGNAVNYILNNYFPNRNEPVLNQLKDKELFRNILPPQFSSRGGVVEKGFTITLLSDQGNIYFTTDGTDPYSPFTGNKISPMAINYTGEITITKTSTIKTRLVIDDEWSPLDEARFIIAEDLTDLKVTELHYHPADLDTIDDSEYEFIELKNTGSSDLVLTGSSFADGIVYTFPDKILAPGNFYVISSNSQEFFRRYEFLPDGEYDGQLDNSGERVALINAAGDTIFSFIYDDNSPWPVEPDGDGYSLAAKSKNGAGDPGDPSYWAASGLIHGSPGSDDIISAVSELSVFPIEFKLEQNFPNPFNPVTTIKYSIPYSGMNNNGSQQFVTLKVYDVLGKEIATLVKELQQPGFYEIEFKTDLLSSGVYFYQLETGNFVETKKMILLR